MAGRKHLIAVNRTVTAADLDSRPSAAVLVDLARNLARRMDKAGGDDAPISLVTAYQSAVARLHREAARETGSKPSRGFAADPVQDDDPEDALTAFERRWKIGPEYADGPDVERFA